ncbi:MAG TPA: HipA domain-containing protein, partial [Steroidobacteraceae bacterium]|nr:HipA domain-containing protein [Steroidobacteraceae bacterium]
VQMLGTLYSLSAAQFYFEPASNLFAPAGVSRDLPYYLHDQRPAGFLGRAVPSRYPELHLPQRVIDWNDDHYLRYLTQHGSDAVSDLILGDRAFDQFLLMQTKRTIVGIDDRETRYPQLATTVMEGGSPGSTAHGEHPKFAALIGSTSEPVHVLVKFSPPNNTAVGQRWSDLLVAEHIAHEVLGNAGLPAARSRIECYGDRTYLEVVRFDRAGLDGRVGVTSLFAIDAEFYGKVDNWIDAATRLRDDARIDAETCELVRLVATFGALIANTDRHFGNLAFYDAYDGRYTIAPVYDMLPMLFAPEPGQVIARIFQPPDPTSQTIRAYGRARALAVGYWRRCANDPRIGPEFRAICGANGAALDALPRTGAYK